MIKIMKFDLKRNINKTTVCIFLIFMLIGVVINQVSIAKHNREVAKQSKFLELEKKRINLYQNYFELAKSGFEILAVSAPTNVLFCDSNTYTGDLICFINSFDKLEIEIVSPKKGIDVFDKPAGGVFDFSWYLMAIGSIFILALGWPSLRDKEYLKTLVSLNHGSVNGVYCGILAGRILLFTSALILTVLISGIHLFFNGLLTSNGITGLLSFLFNALIFMVLLFIFSAVMGMLKNKTVGIGLTVIVLFSLLFLWPKVQNSIISQKTINFNKERINCELKKLDILTNFESSLSKEIEHIKDISKRNNVVIEWIERFYNNEFREIEKIELDMINQIERIVKKHHFWSIFNPVTFYKSVNNELSSRGYNAYLDFYKHVQQKQRQFLRFYIDKRFYEKSTVVEPFLKDDEYIYQLKPSLPDFFWLGVLVQFFYISVLFLFGFRRFKKIIFTSGEEFDKKKLEKFIINEKDYNVWYAKGRGFMDALFNIFTKEQFEKLPVKTAEIARSKEQFFYICRPDEIPGSIRVKDLLTFHGGKESETRLDDPEIKSLRKKSFAELTCKQKFTVVQALLRMKKEAIYLLDDIDMAADMNTIKLDDAMKDLSKAGSIVIFISRSANEIEFIPEDICLENNWDTKVGALRGSIRLAEKSKK